MSDTIFDRILRKEIPAQVVYEDEAVLAFRDIQPQAPIHVLVIPRTRFESLRAAEEVDERVLSGFLRGIARTAKALGLDDGGYRVVFNNGKDAQQSVAYCHAHILAGRPLGWPPG